MNSFLNTNLIFKTESRGRSGIRHLVLYVVRISLKHLSPTRSRIHERTITYNYDEVSEHNFESSQA
jgi:hypothetical protein